MSKPPTIPPDSLLDTAVKNRIQSILKSPALAISSNETSRQKEEQDDDFLLRQMMLKEAQLAAQKYREGGVAGLLEPDKPTLKANKRFLATVIKRTDAHNEALRRKEMGLSPRRPQRSSSPSTQSPPRQMPSSSRVRDTSTLPTTQDTPSSSTPKRRRGRGHIDTTTVHHLDKIFQDDYDPRLDMDNYDDTNLDIYVDNVEEARLRLYDKAKKRHHDQVDTMSSSASSSSPSDSESLKSKKKKKKRKKVSKKSKKKKSKSRKSSKDNDRKYSVSPPYCPVSPSAPQPASPAYCPW